MYDLKGKVYALVTGAGGQRGMGRAIATRLAQEGADVVCERYRTQPLRRTVCRLGRHRPGCAGDRGPWPSGHPRITADVSDASQVTEMVQQALSRFGHIDILVNNAGSRPGKDRVPVVELEEEAFDEVQRVNVKGTFLCSQAVAREMIARGQGGKIIIISSVAGKRGVARYAAYCASKFALVGFTQALALELAPHKINVNAICPGLVDTERPEYIAAALAPEGVSAREQHALMLREGDQRVPLGRVAQADDIARTAAYLASDQSDYLTGLSISVAGGSNMT